MPNSQCSESSHAPADILLAKSDRWQQQLSGYPVGLEDELKISFGAFLSFHTLWFSGVGHTHGKRELKRQCVLIQTVRTSAENSSSLATLIRTLPPLHGTLQSHCDLILQIGTLGSLPVSLTEVNKSARLTLAAQQASSDSLAARSCSQPFHRPYSLSPM